MGNPSTFHNVEIRPGMAIGNDSSAVILTADDTPINVAYKRVSFLRLGSDSTTASARTFTILPGAVDGHVLFIHFITTGSTTAELADSGSMKLSAAWTPVVDGTLTIMWDKGSAVWRELARSAN